MGFPHRTVSLLEGMPKMRMGIQCDDVYIVGIFKTIASTDVNVVFSGLGMGLHIHIFDIVRACKS